MISTHAESESSPTQELDCDCEHRHRCVNHWTIRFRPDASVINASVCIILIISLKKHYVQQRPPTAQTEEEKEQRGNTSLQCHGLTVNPQQYDGDDTRTSQTFQPFHLIGLSLRLWLNVAIRANASYNSRSRCELPTLTICGSLDCVVPLLSEIHTLKPH